MQAANRPGLRGERNIILNIFNIDSQFFIAPEIPDLAKEPPVISKAIRRYDFKSRNWFVDFHL